MLSFGGSNDPDVTALMLTDSWYMWQNILKLLTAIGIWHVGPGFEPAISESKGVLDLV